MSHTCCSGNFSSRSLGGQPCCPGSSGPSYPSNLVYSAEPCAPKPSQRDAALSTGCQETGPEPASCRTSCSSSRTPMFCSPSPTTYRRSLSAGSSSSCSLGDGSRGSYFVICGPSGSTRLRCRPWGSAAQSSGPSLCRPAYYFSSRCYPLSCCRPACGPSAC